MEISSLSKTEDFHGSIKEFDQVNMNALSYIKTSDVGAERALVGCRPVRILDDMRREDLINRVNKTRTCTYRELFAW